MKLKHKKLASALVLLSFLSYMPLSSTMAFALDAGTLPDLNNSINGSVSTNGNRMDVVVNGGAGAIGQFDWNSFNVGANGHVNFGFTNNSQTSLNRVLASGGLSQIYGKLTNSCAGADCSSYMGTGKVILINPNGIMFGNGSEVNLNSFTATTFDLKGAKNIKDMSAEELKAYKNQINVQTNGLPADMVTNAQFVRNGVLTTKDGAAVTLDGTNFDINKSLGIAADNVVVYKDSLIKTSINPNYGGGQNPANHDKTFSNVRIVTGDGVNFNYELNGYVKDHKANTSNSLQNNIKIADSTIESGAVYVENASKVADSDVNIKNSVVKGYKLVKGDFGDIIIKGQNDVNIEGSHLETKNTHRESDPDINTYNQNGGRIAITAGKNVNLTDTKVASAFSGQSFNNSSARGSNAGDISIKAENNNVNLQNTNLHAKGNLTIDANNGSIKATDSVLRARNYSSLEPNAAKLNKKIVLNAKDDITLDNTYSESTDYTTLKADSLNVKNNSTMHSEKNINLFGKNTTIADSTMQYKGLLNFVEDESVLNNVTIAGTTGFNNYTNDLNLTTNGNLTIDNNSLVKRSFGATFDNDTLDANVTLTERGNHDSIALESTKGKVTIKNNSDIKTNTGDISVKALDSTNGEVFVQNSKLAAAANVDIKQALTHNAGTHITKDSTLSGKNIKITTTNSDADINADLANFANLNYSERLVLNAGRDNNITGTGDLNATRVDFNANRNNNLNITGNITTDNTTFNGHVNNITATKNVTLKNTELKAKDTSAPENTKTVVNAGENFTTDGTTLKVNGTKLIANADKDTNIVVSGVNNKKAGIEINAKYNSNELSNKTVTVNAADNVLAISKIKAGNLNLDANDTFLAALTDLTTSDLEGVNKDATGRAYIEVANWGQFNLDPMDGIEYTNPDAFTYTDHFVAGKYQPEAGEAIDTYKKHFIEFDSNGVMEKFLLVYEKPVEGCAPEPPVEGPTDTFNPDMSTPSGETLINQLRLPRQLEPTSRVAPIDNNTTDPTSGIVNAAARIEVDNNATTTKKQQEEEFEI